MPDYTCLKYLLEVLFVPIILAGLAWWLPRRWQNKQKELELKTGLVSEISDAVMTMIAESQVIWDDKLISTLGTDKELVLEKKLLKAHMDWTVKSSRETTNEDAFADYLDAWVKEDFSDEVKGLETPVLVAIGEHDPVLNADFMKQTYLEWLPNAKLETIANAGHYPMKEAPVNMVTMAEAFMAEHI